MPNDTRFEMQDLEYLFPYHYLPELSDDGTPSIHRDLWWGLEYLTYMTYVRDRALALKPQRLLDAGSGDGRMIQLLGTRVPIRVGADLSARSILLAKALNPDAEWYDCAVADVPGTFDAITCVEVMEHIPDEAMADFVASLRAKCAPTGRLIVSVPTIVRPLIPKHYRHYSLAILKQQLSPHFEVEDSAWLFRNNRTTILLNMLMNNRVFLLEHAGLRRLIWRTHRRKTFFGTDRDGAHLVAVCRPV